MVRVENYINNIFNKIPRSKEAKHLKTNLLESAQEKYDDFILLGFSVSSTEDLVIAGVGDITEIRSILYDHSLRRKNTLIGVLIGCLALCHIMSLCFNSLPVEEEYIFLFSLNVYLIVPLFYLLVGWICSHLLCRVRPLREQTAPKMVKIICFFISLVILLSQITVVVFIYCFPESIKMQLPALSGLINSIQFLFLKIPQIYFLIGVSIQIIFFE